MNIGLKITARVAACATAVFFVTAPSCNTSVRQQLTKVNSERSAVYRDTFFLKRYSVSDKCDICHGAGISLHLFENDNQDTGIENLNLYIRDSLLKDIDPENYQPGSFYTGHVYGEDSCIGTRIYSTVLFARRNIFSLMSSQENPCGGGITGSFPHYYVNIDCANQKPIRIEDVFIPEKLSDFEDVVRRYTCSHPVFLRNYYNNNLSDLSEKEYLEKVKCLTGIDGSIYFRPDTIGVLTRIFDGNKLEDETYQDYQTETDSVGLWEKMNNNSAALRFVETEIPLNLIKDYLQKNSVTERLLDKQNGE